MRVLLLPWSLRPANLTSHRKRPAFERKRIDNDLLRLAQGADQFRTRGAPPVAHQVAEQGTAEPGIQVAERRAVASPLRHLARGGRDRRQGKLAHTVRDQRPRRRHHGESLAVEFFLPRFGGQPQTPVLGVDRQPGRAPLGLRVGREAELIEQR